MAAYRVADASQTTVPVSVVTSALRIEPTSLDTDIEDARGAARGALVGVVLRVPFWIGVYAMVF